MKGRHTRKPSKRNQQLWAGFASICVIIVFSSIAGLIFGTPVAPSGALGLTAYALMVFGLKKLGAF